MIKYFKSKIDRYKEMKVKQEEYERNELKNFQDTIGNDEIVLKTSFTPLVGGGSSIITHKLIYDSFGNIILKVKPTFQYIFLGIFLIPLIPFILVAIFSFIVNLLSIDSLINTPVNYINGIWNSIEGVFMVLFFPGLIILFFYFTSKSKIFDFQNGYFYDLRNQKKLFTFINDEKYKNKIIPIKQIHALQIVSERVTPSKNSNFTSYELNMILNDGSRINIIDHGDIVEIKKNAQELSSKLGIKTYDAT